MISYYIFRCWSLIGRIGGKQQISIGNGCAQVGVVTHEIMHALGMTLA